MQDGDASGREHTAANHEQMILRQKRGRTEQVRRNDESSKGGRRYARSPRKRKDETCGGCEVGVEAVVTSGDRRKRHGGLAQLHCLHNKLLEVALLYTHILHGDDLLDRVSRVWSLRSFFQTAVQVVKREWIMRRGSAKRELPLYLVCNSKGGVRNCRKAVSLGSLSIALGSENGARNERERERAAFASCAARGKGWDYISEQR